MTTERKNIMLGTAGHVDHGKTALVKVLTGCDTDRLAVEKERGLTIELGFAPCRMADERIVGIVDVPGHVSFIRNMVAGAHGIDVVILVVAADDGVMPQTREHLDILTLMGVRRGLVALTKIDMVDDEVRELALQDVEQFVAGTFLEGAPVCPVSNVTGEGYEDLLTALNEAVDACEPRQDEGLFRQWVERSFAIRGFGTVASGIPTSGQVAVGDEMRVLPSGRTVRVRGLEVYGQQADVARAGECVAINLADAKDLPRGSLLCEPGVSDPVSMAEADLRLLPSAGRPMKDYTEVHLHVGTAEAMAKVAMLEGHPVEPGQSQFVQLRLARPLALAAGERFVVRAAGGDGRITTLGGGRILGTSNKRLRRNRPWTFESLAARREALDSPADWCALHLKEAGAALSPADLADRAQMRSDHLADVLKQLRADGAAIDTADGRIVHRDAIAAVAGAMTEALEEFHRSNPMRAGMAPADLQARVDAQPGVCEAALAGLVESGKVRHADAVLALPGCGARLSDEDRALCERIESALREAHLGPPLPADIAKSLDITEAKLAEMVAVLGDEGMLVQLDRKVILHRDSIEAAKGVVLELFGKASGFTTMEFRDALAASRKVAVPLLDYFDTQKLTVRTANRRTPGAEAKRLLDGGRDQAPS